MNLLERKSTFDAKVNSYLASTGNAVVLSSPELYYDLYCQHTYQKEFESVIYSIKRDYVIVNFNNQIDKTNGKNK